MPMLNAGTTEATFSEMPNLAHGSRKEWSR
jgi:hypothetical protein